MKIKNLLLLGAAVISLSGCFEQEEEVPYQLTLQFAGVSSQISSTKKLTANGTDEFGEKTGEKEGGGIFLDNEYIALKAPVIAGYRFLGWDDGVGQKFGLNDTNLDDGTYDCNWNMSGHDTTLKATYEKINLQIMWSNIESGQSNPNASISSWNIDDGLVTLQDATTTNPHEHFDHWYYVDTSSGTRKEVETTTIPQYYEDSDYICFFAYWTIDKFALTIEIEGEGEVLPMFYNNDGVTLMPGFEKIDSTHFRIEYGKYLSFKIIPTSPNTLANVSINGGAAQAVYHNDQSASDYSFDFTQGQDTTLKIVFSK